LYSYTAEFDPAEHDKLMSQMYGQEYYDEGEEEMDPEVGLCTLNQVDP
jgi:hypothetical protein